jgi:hypothetical protein
VNVTVIQSRVDCPREGHHYVQLCSNAQTRVSDCRMLDASDRDRLRPSGGREVNSDKERKIAMLYTVAVILLIAWLLGVVGTYTIGAFVQVFLVTALVSLFVVGLLSGRRSRA